jgi:tetratricopeptide (TPR) repeat protein
MRPIFAVLLLAAALGPASSARAYTDLGIRPHWRNEAAVYLDLSMDDRFARIDELEASLWRGETIDDSTRIELIGLYRSSPLMKHRVVALEHANELEGTIRLRQRSMTLRRTFNPWDTREALIKWGETEPWNAEPQRRLAIEYLDEALITQDEEWFDRSAEQFARAAELEDGNADDWRGIAVARIGARRLNKLTPIAKQLLELAPESPGSHLIAALGQEATGAVNRAALSFEQAFARMDPDTRYRFENPSALRFATDAGPFGPELVRAAPPVSDRGWWIRMIEVAALFSRPGYGTDGWDTAAGQVYLKYGRPEFMRSYGHNSSGQIVNTPELSPYRDTLLPQIHSAPQHTLGAESFWVWLIRLSEDRLYPVVFAQLTRFASWGVNDVSNVFLLETQKTKGPFRLAYSLPEVKALDESITLDVKITAFRESEGRLRVEAWSATTAEADAAVGSVRLRVLGVDGQEVDRADKPFDQGHRRAWLAERLRGFPEGVQGWVHGFGAVLSPAEYLVIVDVLDENGEMMATRDRRVGFDAATAARDGFGMSEPLLCDAYEQTLLHPGLEPEFVRYARAVIPHPESTLHPGQREISVYYELYGATTDSRGRARLRIEYEVLPAEGFDPYVGDAGYVDGELAQPVVRAVFEDDRTGTTTGGRVIRGTRLQVDELGPGDYVLIVRTSDRLARRETQRTVRFQVPASAGS